MSNRLTRLLNNKYKVYNMAPCNWGQFDSYLKKGLIKKPKLIIYPIGETNVLPNFKAFEKESNFFGKKFIQEICYSGLNVPADKILRLYSLKWVKSRYNGVQNFGVKTQNSGDMFFAQGEKMYKFSEQEIKQNAEAIKSYKKYCDSLNILFLYLTTPNKETVYYELIPFSEQPSYYKKLTMLLQPDSVKGINSLNIFNRFKKNNTQLVYHLDDTHWNSLGIELISREIAKYIQQNNIPHY